MKNFAIQLYSVRDHFLSDPQKTYAALKTAGYDFVELFAVGPDDAARHKDWLDHAGLSPICAHVDFETATDRTAEVADMARILSIDFVVMPWYQCDALAEWDRMADALDQAGAKLREDGIRLGYHNHDHEFRAIDGTVPMDRILERCAPENVFIELDFYWAETGGVDAFATLAELGRRCPLLHIKDRPADGPIPFTEMGAGTTDWPRLIDTARGAGVEWFIVEQDESTRDTLESAAISAAFMRALA